MELLQIGDAAGAEGRVKKCRDVVQLAAWHLDEPALLCAVILRRVARQWGQAKRRVNEGRGHPRLRGQVAK